MRAAGELVSGLPVPRVWFDRSGKVRLSASPCPVRLADGFGADSESRELLSLEVQNRSFLLGGGLIPETSEAMERDGVELLNIMGVVLNLEDFN
jgi:hypothetical protein